MKKLTLGIIAGLIVFSGSTFAEENTQNNTEVNSTGNMEYEARWGNSRPEGHPVVSIGFTEVIMTDRWVDSALMEVRGFKNLDDGLAVGAKVATNFHDESEIGFSVRKTLVDTLHAYGDAGYSSIDESDGAFAEVGVGAYFWKDNILGINGGFKHYFDSSDTAFTVGFTINFF